VRGEHEVVEDQLFAVVEEVEECLFAGESVEFESGGIGDSDHGEVAAGFGELLEKVG
jgi:hypothetical protein